MLINLTFDQEEVDRIDIIRKKIGYPSLDKLFYNLKYGIYHNGLNHFPQEFFKDSFVRSYNEHLYETKKMDGESELRFMLRYGYVEEYGVADNIEQIEKYYEKQINDSEEKFVILIDYVYQDRRKKNKVWRWHKHGVYIGEYPKRTEYLNDEKFKIKKPLLTFELKCII